MGKSVNVGGGFLVVLLCFLGCLQVGLAQSNAKGIIISWDDMKMDERSARVSSRHDFNGSRVIVVDKNGGADSLTVQGAIDLVPQYNTQRVKIYVLPGIYRFVQLFFRKSRVLKYAQLFLQLVLFFCGGAELTGHKIVAWNVGY